MKDDVSIVVISGPTAAGKTSAAVEVSLLFDGEIVGADSVQVYRHADIGSAKPDAEELKGVRHHLIDVVEPGADFNAADYVSLADTAISDIHQRHKLPVVAGGSGLYIRALLKGLSGAPPADAATRESIQSEAQEKGWDHMHRILKKVDPVTADRLHVNDNVRISRALEVYTMTGRALSSFHDEHAFSGSRYRCLKLGIQVERQQLVDRINARVDSMIEAGFIDEVKALMEAGCPEDRAPLNGIGYSALARHLRGDMDLETAISKIKTETARYAKRQMTWMRGEGDWIWTEPGSDRLIEEIRMFIENT